MGVCDAHPEALDVLREALAFQIEREAREDDIRLTTRDGKLEIARIYVPSGVRIDFAIGEHRITVGRGDSVDLSESIRARFG